MTHSEFVDTLEHQHQFTKLLANESDLEDEFAIKLRIIDMLNSALATEIMCSLRYKSHALEAKKLGENIVANEFEQHAVEEQEHADKLAKRIAQLDGTPHMSPQQVSNESHSSYSEARSLDEMIRENYLAEAISVHNYQAMIVYIDNKDPTTRRLLEDILAVEEEHADDLSDFANKYHVDLGKNNSH